MARDRDALLRARGRVLVPVVLARTPGRLARRGRIALRIAAGALASPGEARRVTGPPGAFLQGLRARARSAKHKLVFPEGTDPRVHESLRDALSSELYEAILLGPPDSLREALRAAGIDERRVTVLDPASEERVEHAAVRLHELRAHHGLTMGDARELARDPLLQAALLVRDGEAAGAVAGAVRPTADVIRAGLRGLGLRGGVDILSSSFYMVLDRLDPRADDPAPSVLTFTDAGVVPDPT
ncbi:MAG TPA: hypothetical protein EYQ02_06635, partial [Microbacterium sp.]|nr:hypothetical protein [Microbacterium sp.]